MLVIVPPLLLGPITVERRCHISANSRTSPRIGPLRCCRSVTTLPLRPAPTWCFNSPQCSIRLTYLPRPLCFHWFVFPPFDTMMPVSDSAEKGLITNNTGFGAGRSGGNGGHFLRPRLRQHHGVSMPFWLRSSRPCHVREPERAVLRVPAAFLGSWRERHRRRWHRRTDVVIFERNLAGRV